MIHVLFTARCATGLNFLHWMSCYLVNRTPVILGKLTSLQVWKHHAVVETVHLLSHKTRVWLFDSFTENLILCLSVLPLLFLKQVKERQRKKTNHAALSQSTDWRTVAKNPSNNSPREATASWRPLEPRVSPARDAVQRLVLRQTDFTFNISHLGDWKEQQER